MDDTTPDCPAGEFVQRSAGECRGYEVMPEDGYQAALRRFEEAAEQLLMEREARDDRLLVIGICLFAGAAILSVLFG